METRDLNPEAAKPEVATTPATPAESLESQSIADAGINLAEAEAAAAGKARLNEEAAEAQMADKAFQAAQTVTAVEAEETETAVDASADEATARQTEDEIKTKEDIMARLTKMAADETVEISREEISHLKQRFYAIRKAEQEAELTAHLADGKDAESFIPALDPAEEEFKSLMNTVRERKAAQGRSLLTFNWS